jgi:chemotaxis protein CheC
MSSSDLGGLTAAFRTAAARSSVSLSQWLGRPTAIIVQDVAACALDQAAGALGTGAETLCVCAMQVGGHTPGIIALAVSDEAGLAMADLLLGRPAGESREWGDIERSAMAETANIIGCAYLNAVADASGDGGELPALVPSPPWFVRDYPEAVMASLIATQTSDDPSVFLTRTAFGIEGTAIRCSLVFVPQSVAAGRPRSGLAL